MPTGFYYYSRIRTLKHNPSLLIPAQTLRYDSIQKRVASLVYRTTPKYKKINDNKKLKQGRQGKLVYFAAWKGTEKDLKMKT